MCYGDRSSSGRRGFCEKSRSSGGVFAINAAAVEGFLLQMQQTLVVFAIHAAAAEGFLGNRELQPRDFCDRCSMSPGVFATDTAADEGFLRHTC